MRILVDVDVSIASDPIRGHSLTAADGWQEMNLVIRSDLGGQPASSHLCSDANAQARFHAISLHQPSTESRKLAIEQLDDLSHRLAGDIE